MTKALDLSVYLVTDRGFLQGRPLESIVLAAVKGGVGIVQLREKEASSREFYELALTLKQVLAPYRVPLIINDRMDIALAVDADGIHIGHSDLPYAVARSLLGPDKIIGVSVDCVSDAVEANLLDVDYIAVSPVFDTTTKTDTAPASGLNGLAAIRKTSRHPCIGIGGIHLSNVEDVINAGAEGVAVVSAIMAAENPTKAAEAFLSRINHAKQSRAGSIASQ